MSCRHFLLAVIAGLTVLSIVPAARADLLPPDDSTHPQKPDDTPLPVRQSCSARLVATVDTSASGSWALLLTVAGVGLARVAWCGRDRARRDRLEVRGSVS
jgi:hypothetical protein